MHVTPCMGIHGCVAARGASASSAIPMRPSKSLIDLGCQCSRGKVSKFQGLKNLDTLHVCQPLLAHGETCAIKNLDHKKVQKITLVCLYFVVASSYVRDTVFLA